MLNDGDKNQDLVVFIRGDTINMHSNLWAIL